MENLLNPAIPFYQPIYPRIIGKNVILGSDNSNMLSINNITSIGAVSCTLGANAPTGTPTTPTGWLMFNINGSIHAMPYF